MSLFSNCSSSLLTSNPIFRPSFEEIFLNSSISGDDLTILVTDNLGKIILEKYFSDLNNIELKIQDLDPGIYYVNILGDKYLNKKISFIKTNN